MRWFVLVLAILGCSQTTASRTPRKTTGAIAGLARDHDSGDPVAAASVHVRAQGQMTPLVTTTSKEGIYGIDDLPPGRYSLSALFAGQPIEISNIDVRANEATIVDLVFTLGRPEPISLVFGDATSAAIDRYRPKNLSSAVAVLEGTVNDLATKERIAGAVVNAVGPGPAGPTLQVVTDDQGRYRFETGPGVYIVSAYYSVGGHAQIEVRRSDIAAAGGEVVVVPLWIESAR